MCRRFTDDRPPPRHCLQLVVPLMINFLQGFFKTHSLVGLPVTKREEIEIPLFFESCIYHRYLEFFSSSSFLIPDEHVYKP